MYYHLMTQGIKGHKSDACIWIYGLGSRKNMTPKAPFGGSSQFDRFLGQIARIPNVSGLRDK
ncbi:MAG: hypothetical protein LIO81_10755 [Clostridiales bacterium]|nr:hypothetical protein [Clostridiales bacterium]